MRGGGPQSNGWVAQGEGATVSGGGFLNTVQAAQADQISLNEFLKYEWNRSILLLIESYGSPGFRTSAHCARSQQPCPALPPCPWPPARPRHRQPCDPGALTHSRRSAAVFGGGETKLVPLPSSLFTSLLSFAWTPFDGAQSLRYGRTASSSVGVGIGRVARPAEGAVAGEEREGRRGRTRRRRTASLAGCGVEEKTRGAQMRVRSLLFDLPQWLLL